MASESQMNESNRNPRGTAHHGMLENKTDLAAIKCGRVFVLLDEQNLSITARSFGYALQYDLLAKRIHVVAQSAELHIFTAAEPHDRRVKRRFENLGYIVHLKTIRRTRLPDGRQRIDCNVDNLFAFWAGLLVAKNTYDVIVLASGDYGLAGELSEAIYEKRRDDRIKIMTLSLPGSTAQDLDADKNQNIAVNLEVGLDLLKRLRLSDQLSPARTLDSFCVFRSSDLPNHSF